MRNTFKNKIYFAVLLWLALGFVMFAWIFAGLETANQSMLESIMSLKKEQARLLAEKESFQQAKNDLARLAAQAIQPESFFSRDISLVNELKRLEGMAKDLGLDLNLAGIAGSLKSAERAKTKSEIFQIPYSIHLQGPLDKIVGYMEDLENLEFITAVNLADLSSAGKDRVNATLSAVFYLKK